jgi:hypothetical protein
MYLIRLLVLVVHSVSSAALLGGALYSFLTVQPRAKAHFKDVRDFETFVANLAHGARWKVLTLLTAIAITGFVNPLLSEPVRPQLWWICFGIKGLLWAAVLSSFVYVSWNLWPRRIFAALTDLAAIRREFAVIGSLIVVLLMIAFVLGVVMSQIR